MNTITIITYDSFGERKSEKDLDINDFLLLADKWLVDLYNLWAKRSSIDGTNFTMELSKDNKRYIFVNHYWD